MNAVRTRFAPSPTGYLHVGTARTALFNYLFARRNAGRFILRIEDTDTERNVAGGAEAIVLELGWLGLSWDEGFAVGGPNGPYVQTERLSRYHEAVSGMVASGAAYPCYCTPEDIERRRQIAGARAGPPGYDGHCRELSPAQIAAFEAEDRHPAIRFRLPDEGETIVDDLIRGRIAFDNATLTDFVIMRASGIPTYMLSAVFDDVDMDVSHVIRGEDLLASTPRQVHVFRALGRPEPPAFAHLPLIVGADRRKLSKRHGETSLAAFREEGYLPEALVNYLALLGWSLDDHSEHFSLADLEQVFSIERVSHNPAAFDTHKLDAINGYWIRRLSDADFAARADLFIREQGGAAVDLGLLEEAAPLVKERITHLTEVAGMVGFLGPGDVEPSDEDVAKVLTPEGRDFLQSAAEALAGVEPWSAGAVESALRQLQTERGISAKKAFQPVRLAITGRLVSPPLFESMAVLGRERSLGRIDAVLGRTVASA